jgi:hypothetical protein
MARPIRSIEIYLPLDYNDGQPIPESKYVKLQLELLQRFGGLTSTQRQFPLEGLWKTGPGVFHDRVVVFSAMDLRNQPQLECLQYLQRLKARLKRNLGQLEILITVGELLAV